MALKATAPPRRGVVYIATGSGHFDAARASAASLRATNPSLGIVAFTDQPGPAPEFDELLPIDTPHARSKVDLMPKSPFEETLFIDSDTRVVGDLSEAFRLLERFDVALAHRVYDPGRLARESAPHTPPAAYPEHNSGVFFFRRTPEVLDFLANWAVAYHARGKKADQVSLREQLWKSDLRIAILPRRYNVRQYSWVDHLGWRGPRPVVLHINLFHPTKQGGPIRKRLEALSVPPLRRINPLAEAIPQRK
ncbi:putative nucleotide-diphospho-sugar transferase [Amaricoccus macauensis]|uniref:putative nucleotide-diphospho-sugar transferase n=1 Tax=Amaricoccus macauensis TaxID=57001 RepID=UPI003C7CFDE9